MLYRKMSHLRSNFAFMKDKLTNRTVKSPEGVALLMENMWFRHSSGMKQSSDNVFYVELPPLTEEERAEIHRKDALHPFPDENDKNDEEFLGGWI